MQNKADPVAGRCVPWWHVVAALLLLALAWQLRTALLLLFGALLVAMALSAAAVPLRRLGLARALAVPAATAAIAMLIGLGLWQLGEPLATQMQGLRVAVPQAWQVLSDWLHASSAGQRVLQWLGGMHDAELPVAGIAGAATQALGALSAGALMLVIGIFMAMDVHLYRHGVLGLVPAAGRARIERALRCTGQGLSRWLLGQALLMGVVGVAVSTGLSVLGMPLALALGLIAGLLEFVPFFGPIAAGALAVLVAFAQGPAQALYVALLFIALQQLESVLLVPLIQRWTVRLPPVLGLMAVLLFAPLFGPLGVVFGTPLMVVIMVLVRTLYVEDVLQPPSDDGDGGARERCDAAQPVGLTG
jgi:predicted PurR-regulated permease PerM